MTHDMEWKPAASLFGRLLPVVLIAASAGCYWQVDARTARWVDRNAGGKNIQQIWLATSEIGNGWWYALGIPAACFYFHKKKREAAARAALAMGAAILTSGLAVNLIKFVAHRPRPGIWLKHDQWGFRWHLDWPTAASFPSGHATTITAAMLVMWHVKPGWKRLWMVLMGVVFTGRVMGGWHFVSDVLAGMALGMIAAWFWAKKLKVAGSC